MRVKSRFVLIFLLGMVATISTDLSAQGQVSEPFHGSVKTRFNLYGNILGSIELPDGYQGHIYADFIDAWAGHIESKSTGFKMDWRAGTVVYVLEKRKNDIEWRKDEKVGDTAVTRASLKEMQGETLVTKIGWMEFSALIRNEEDERAFTSLIDSYQKESCRACIPFRRKINN